LPSGSVLAAPEKVFGYLVASYGCGDAPDGQYCYFILFQTRNLIGHDQKFPDQKRGGIFLRNRPTEISGCCATQGADPDGFRNFFRVAEQRPTGAHSFLAGKPLFYNILNKKFDVSR
jgi:hypothetical protein